MRAMVPERFYRSKPAGAASARLAFSGGIYPAGWLTGGVTMLALFCWLSGLDAWIAKAIYAPDASWGWALRQWGAWLGGASAVAALPLCLWAPLARKAPLWQQSALILLLTAVLGAGLLNQVVVKDLANRPRPRDVLLSTAVPANATIQPASATGGEGLHGKSMPSGHAGMAGVLVAPFFVLRRRKPKLALAFLLGGGAATALVGVARMALGAHFLSDVLVAGGINLAVAAALAPGVQRWVALAALQPRRGWLTSSILGAGLVIGVLAMMLGNRFTLTLVYPLPASGPVLVGFDLPCLKTDQVQARAVKGLHMPQASLELQGYGAPLSQLKLKLNGAGRLVLARRYGLYHHLRCSVVLEQPAG